MYLYVLFNNREHVEIEKRRRGRRSVQESERQANLSFFKYFKSKVNILYINTMLQILLIWDSEFLTYIFIIMLRIDVLQIFVSSAD